jgi:hypothetical protein
MEHPFVPPLSLELFEAQAWWLAHVATALGFLLAVVAAQSVSALSRRGPSPTNAPALGMALGLTAAIMGAAQIATSTTHWANASPIVWSMAAIVACLLAHALVPARWNGWLVGLAVAVWCAHQLTAGFYTTPAVWVLPVLTGFLLSRTDTTTKVWAFWGAMVSTTVAMAPAYDQIYSWQPSFVLLAVGPAFALCAPLMDKRPPEWVIGVFWASITAALCIHMLPNYKPVDQREFIDSMIDQRVSINAPIVVWGMWLAAIAVAIPMGAWRTMKPRVHSSRAVALTPLLLGAGAALLAFALLLGEREIPYVLGAVAVCILGVGIYLLVAKDGKPSCPPEVATILLGVLGVVAIAICTRDGVVHLPILFMHGAALALTVSALVVGAKHPAWFARLGWFLVLLWLWVLGEKPSPRRGMDEWVGPAEFLHFSGAEVWGAAALAGVTALIVAWAARRHRHTQDTLPWWMVAVFALGQAVAPITTTFPNDGTFGYFLVTGVLLSLWAHTAQRPWLAWPYLCLTAFGLLTYGYIDTIAVPDVQEAALVLFVLALIWRRFDWRDTTPWAWLGVTVFWTAIWASTAAHDWLFAEPVSECVGCIYETYHSNERGFPYHLGSTLGWFAFLAFSLWLTGLSLWYRAQPDGRKEWIQRLWILMGALGVWATFESVWASEHTIAIFHAHYGPAWTGSVVLGAAVLLLLVLENGDRTARTAGLMLLSGGTVVLAVLGLSWQIVAAAMAVCTLAWLLIDQAPSRKARTLVAAGTVLGCLGLIAVPHPVLLWAGVVALLPLAAWLARGKRHIPATLAAVASMALVVLATGVGIQP